MRTKTSFHKWTLGALLLLLGALVQPQQAASISLQANAAEVVWDFGPTTGETTPPEGNGTVLVNASNDQNLADLVMFSTETTITGYSLFTASSHLPPNNPQYGPFLVRFWADNNGRPGAVLREVQVNTAPLEPLGNFLTTAGNTTDVHRISLNFEPVVLAANTRYWVGASGLNYDVGTYGVVAPGDGQMAQMSGANFQTLISGVFGDLMFQLVGTLTQDTDNDGVSDDRDLCPNTALGVLVNADGCAIEQLCSCDGPWKNHGEFLTCIRTVLEDFYRADLITVQEYREIFRAAAESDCGKKQALSSYSRHPAAALNRLVTTRNGRFGRDGTHAATANVVVSETTSHSRQRRRITVR